MIPRCSMQIFRKELLPDIGNDARGWCLDIELEDPELTSNMYACKRGSQALKTGRLSATLHHPHLEITVIKHDYASVSLLSLGRERAVRAWGERALVWLVGVASETWSRVHGDAVSLTRYLQVLAWAWRSTGWRCTWAWPYKRVGSRSMILAVQACECDSDGWSHASSEAGPSEKRCSEGITHCICEIGGLSCGTRSPLNRVYKSLAMFASCSSYFEPQEIDGIR